MALVDGYRGAVLADSPAGFWELDEASGSSAADSSGNGHAATYSGGLIHSTTVAPIGGDDAHSFGGVSGSSSAVNGSVPATALNVGGSGTYDTVELWMRWDGGGSGEGIFDFQSSTYAYALWITPSTIGFISGNGEMYGGPTRGLANEWHLVDAEFENGSINLSKLYIDGVAQTLSLQGTNRALTVSSSSGNVAFQIGGWRFNTNNRFTGQIDEVSVFKGDLSSAQISAHWNAAVSGTDVPGDLTPPTISGPVEDNQTISAARGAWAGSPTSYAYQWLRCDSLGGGCAAISGATGPALQLGDSDVGHTFEVSVTASNADGATTATSAPTQLAAPLASALSAPMDAAVSAATPWGYWHFADTNGPVATDAAGGGNDLTVTTPTWNTGGPACDRSAVTLTGPSLASLGSGTTNDFLDNFSEEAWVKFPPPAPGASWAAEVFGFGNDSTNGWSLFVNGTDKQLTLKVGSTFAIVGPVLEFGDPQHLAWYHVGVTRDAGTWKLYLDGLLVGSASGFSPVAPSAFNLWFGGGRGGSNPEAETIADAAFYKHPLDDATMAAHATTLLRPVPTTQQAYGPVGSGDLGVNPGGDPFGGPVDTATGNYLSTATDVATDGPGIPLVFARTYNSGDSATGPFGPGWTDSLNWTATPQTDGSVVIRSGTGQQLDFLSTGTGTYAAPRGGRATLTASGGGYTLVTNDQTHYVFDSSGRLTSETDRNGVGLLLGYDASGLSTVTDGAGRVLNVTISSGLITQISLANGGGTVGYAYDANGRLQTVTDVRGGVTTYTYDATSGKLTSIKDPTSTVVATITYDSSSGRVTDVMDALSKHTTYAWDATTQTATVTTPDGKVWKELYNNGVLVKWIDGTSDMSYFERELNFGLTSATSPSGDETTMTYDANGNVLTATAPDSLGNVKKTFTYDAKNNPLTVTDAKGNVTSYSYDASGNLLTVKLNGTQVASYTYNANGQELTATDANSHTTTYTYDTAGNVESVTDPLGNETTYTYDTNGRVLTRVDPLGNAPGGVPADHTTTYTYDAAGDVLTETDPLGHVTTNTYDGAGRLLTSKDPRGNTTTYAYDGNGNLLTVTGADPDGAGPLSAPVTTYTYDNSGNELTETDPNNHTTIFGYDGSNRVISETDSDGDKTTYGYDANGNLAKIVDPRGNVTGANPADFTTDYTYDAAGRQLTSTDPLGHKTSYFYDSVGNLATVTDANHHSTTYTYDAVGRVLTVTAPDNGVTTYAYDGNGNELSRTDANSHTTNYVYDKANELVQATGVDPDGSGPLPAPVTSYSYDANGNLVSTTDPNGNATSTAGDGTTTRTYDNANRLTGIAYSERTPSVSYSYDADGNRSGMTDGSGSVSYTYDALDRLTSVARGSDSFGYTYDAAGNVKSRTFPGGLETDYTYDPEERLTSAATGSASTSYGYDPAGNLVRTTLPSSNGYVETRTYDDAGRLTDVKNANASAVLSEFAVTLDPVGNPTEIVRSGATSSTTTYGYDAADRLTSVCYQASCGASDPQANWTYDKVGNRLTETTQSGTTNYTYNAADELTQAGSTAYTYDASGNELTAGTNTYTYDLENRMASANDGTTTTNYAYDGDGNRLQESSGSAASDTTNFLWDTNAADGVPQLALERDGSGTTLRSYAYGNARISMTTAAAAFYYHYDPLGSVANITSSSGASEWTYAYSPFGMALAATKNDPSAPANPMQFAGEYNDPNGLYDLRARQYDPVDGRFSSIDPAQQTSGGSAISAYAYVDDRATVMTDPSGERFDSINLGAGESAVAAAAAAASPAPQPPTGSGPTPPSPTGSVRSRTSATATESSSGSPAVSTSAAASNTPAAQAPSSLSPVDGGQTDRRPGFSAVKVVEDMLNLWPTLPEPAGDVMVTKQRNLRGFIFYEPGTVNPLLRPNLEVNQNIIRVYEDANGNFTMRYYNEHGQPVNPATGKPGSRAETHIPAGYRGKLLGLPRWWTGK